MTQAPPSRVTASATAAAEGPDLSEGWGEQRGRFRKDSRRLDVPFFLPYGLLVAELGSASPVQGGPYVWTRLAFGRLTAGLNQILYALGAKTRHAKG